MVFQWWVLPTALRFEKTMRVVRIRVNQGCLGYVEWKNQQLTSNKSLAELRSTWGDELWELQRLLCKNPMVIYHPTIPDPWNDWTFSDSESVWGPKRRCKSGKNSKGCKDWRSQMENQQVFKTDTCDGLRKILGFHQIPVFFFWKIRFQFPDCFFQMCQIVTRLPFKNPRYSDDLRDTSIDAEWLFNVPAFLIVDPVACEWNLTSSPPPWEFNNANTLW